MTADLIIERGRRVLNLEASALADVENALGEDFVKRAAGDAQRLGGGSY